MEAIRIDRVSGIGMRRITHTHTHNHFVIITREAGWGRGEMLSWKSRDWGSTLCPTTIQLQLDLNFHSSKVKDGTWSLPAKMSYTPKHWVSPLLSSLSPQG